MKNLKEKAIRNIVTSDFEIEEGLRIAFEEGYKDGQKKNNLGCRKEIKINTINGFICGVPNAWGEIRICEDCKYPKEKIILSKKICKRHNLNYVLSPIFGLICPECKREEIKPKNINNLKTMKGGNKDD